MNWYFGVLKKYAVFKGRAGRKEYWFFNLYHNLIIGAGFFLSTLDGMAFLWSVASGIYTLVFLIPAIAVSVRRLHDTDRSGWWFLFISIPVIGPLTFFVFTVQDGTPGTNKYGANPKESAFIVSHDKIPGSQEVNDDPGTGSWDSGPPKVDSPPEQNESECQWVLAGFDYSGKSTRICLQQQGLDRGVVLGRNPDSECFKLEDDTVSGRHVNLFVAEGQLWVEDLGSTNGTWVDDVRVAQGAVVVANVGSRLKLGGTELHISRI